MGLKVQVTGLNEFLTALFGREMRLSTLLSDLGYDPEQIQILRENHIEHIVALYLECLREHAERGKNGARLYEVLTRRFGLDGKSPETLHDIGQQFNLSRERIRQLEEKVLKKYRHPANVQFLETTLRNIVQELGFSPNVAIENDVTFGQ